MYRQTSPLGWNPGGTRSIDTQRLEVVCIDGNNDVHSICSLCWVCEVSDGRIACPGKDPPKGRKPLLSLL